MQMHVRLRTVATGLAAIAVLATAGCGDSDTDDAGATSEPAKPAKPAIVLVHGSFSDTSSWNTVADNLRGQGYQVVQPENPLRGPAADAAAVTTAIASISGPVVLVGHSYGGAVISNIHRPDVKAEVFVAAFAPQQGETVQALSDPGRYPGSKIGPAIQVQPTETGAEVTITPDQYGVVFAQDVSGDVAARLAAKQRPTSAAANAEPSGAPSWASVPSWYLISTDDQVLPPAAQRFQADRMHAKTSEVKSSHASPVSHPDAVVATIVAAAGAS
ncbi:alpha/beta hydrolase [Nocardia bovistercoris]|uniref:Alpha/beta hydrolase n=1 Tax=Nocardia bovistercoris TaxID=2785916 RepID=A0A931IAS9_9NOCA|nr:alpha/beta hydrolase [Nocardia bovistercoris]MBH0777924.1 alpha/beta hydrolase [Nocardia bovistercoris]